MTTTIKTIAKLFDDEAQFDVASDRSDKFLAQNAVIYDFAWDGRFTLIDPGDPNDRFHNLNVDDVEYSEHSNILHLNDLALEDWDCNQIE